jgi:hypothetical protein
MRGSSRKRLVSLPDAAASSVSGSLLFDSARKSRRVSSDVRPQLGKQLLKLKFPHAFNLLPIHSVSLSSAPTDDDGDAVVPRRPRTFRQVAHGVGVDLELCVQCSRSSNIQNCGEQVWGASLLLSEYLWSVRHFLSGATVLELGAGLAIPSVCISGFCHRVLVSDCNNVRHLHSRNSALFCPLTFCRRLLSVPTPCGLSPAAAATAPSFTSTGGSRWHHHPYLRQSSLPASAAQAPAIFPALILSSHQTSRMNLLSRGRYSSRCARCSLQLRPMSRLL